MVRTTRLTDSDLGWNHNRMCHLFATDMNLLVKKNNRGSWVSLVVRQQPTRPYQKPLLLPTRLLWIPGGPWQRCTTWSWRDVVYARNAKKSNIEGGEDSEIQDHRWADPPLKEKPIESLGKVFNGTMWDRFIVIKICKQEQEWTSQMGPLMQTFEKMHTARCDLCYLLA